jgi:hypothetical protein
MILIKKIKKIKQSNHVSKFSFITIHYK